MLRALPEPIPPRSEPPATSAPPAWSTAQLGRSSRSRDRYLQEPDGYPATTFPAIAAHAIATYTRPGDLIIDPTAGIGTTLVEAMHLDRMAIGVERDQGHVDLALRNIENAADRGAPGFAAVVSGDARGMEALLGHDLYGKAALVLVSPPSALTAHGVQVPCARRGDGFGDALDVGHRDQMMAWFTQVLAGCRTLLKPGGFLVITVRAERRPGRVGEVAAVAANAALDAGFALHERCAARLVAASECGQAPCASDFRLVHLGSTFALGGPGHIRAQEEIVVACVGRLDDHSIESTGCGCVLDQRYNASSR
ncbi:DNA methyltransferase [Catenulispora rubra]|uniref:DNA methyltransferase n=1 Tax=Catenulispora rubra TaxID=280293 RepID=UPI0018924B2B|nr:DNA methyltransferase [Catenulispora rubra]